MNPANDWTIMTTCRKSDPDRSARFYAAAGILNAVGLMGDMDDGPEQIPLCQNGIESEILSLLPQREYDIIITHSTVGEYTRHRRHEEVAAAVIGLIKSGRLQTSKLWMFAYEDGNRNYLPRPIKDADQTFTIPQNIWNRKYQMITETYGFHKDSWEAKTTPLKESFWTLNSFTEIQEWNKERDAVK